MPRLHCRAAAAERIAQRRTDLQPSHETVAALLAQSPRTSMELLHALDLPSRQDPIERLRALRNYLLDNQRRYWIDANDRWHLRPDFSHPEQPRAATAQEHTSCQAPS
jgi:hypothetical protein